MSRKKKTDEHPKESQQSHLTIVEAVENLSNLAEMDSKDRIGVIEDHLIVHEQSDEEEGSFEAIHWLEEKSQHQTEEVVSDTFKTVLKYVKDFHKKEFNRFYDQKNQDGLKKIMLLVGQASDNLRNYTHLFQGAHEKGIEETKEYKQLSNFYKERIAVEEDEKVSLIDLSRQERNLELTKHPLQEEDEDIRRARQFIVDVEKIKTDDSYELLFMQRDDGSRFFTSQFFRNLKLACNFGEYANKNLERDPLDAVKCWLDHSLQISSVKILKLVQPQLKIFYQESSRYRDMETAAAVNMAIMALMMAANPKNNLEKRPSKSSAEYFQDFQRYLRFTFNSFEYRKLKTSPPPSSNVFLHNLLDIVHLLSWGSYFKHLDLKSFSQVIDDLIEEGKVSAKKKIKASTSLSLWQHLEDNYLHLSRYLLSYPVGPLFETLERMQEGEIEEFDAFMMQNYPLEWSALQLDKQKVSMLHLPSPTRQELINKVKLSGEFVGLMDAYQASQTPKKHLLINLQDRTSWQQMPRSDLLEKMPRQSDYMQSIDVVTLCKESDFYWQRGAYKDLSSIKHFFKQLILQLHSPETGYYFPKWIEEKIFNGFIEKLVVQIHRFFFDSRSKLTQQERCDFIEIFYQFLTLKLLEICSPNSFSFTCKDALDIGATASVNFWAFLKRLTQAGLSKQDEAQINMMLFAYPMLIRQRCIRSDEFERMLNCQMRMETGLSKHSSLSSQKALKKYFQMLFETPFDKISSQVMSLDQAIKKF